MSFFTRFYDVIIRSGTYLQPFFLLIIRLYWGYLFVQTGFGKFVNHHTVVEYFQSLHIPFPEFSAYATAFVETVGGLSLFLGLGARLMSIPLIVVLCTAYATAHHEALVALFQDPDLFISQPPFHFLMASVIIFCFGPGAFSIDYWLRNQS